MPLGAAALIIAQFLRRVFPRARSRLAAIGIAAATAYDQPPQQPAGAGLPVSFALTVLSCARTASNTAGSTRAGTGISIHSSRGAGILLSYPCRTPAYMRGSLRPVNPNLPPVLIIGDSISISYTLPVRQTLEGVANVIRPVANCESTLTILEKIDRWLGQTQWAVIHFNAGLHDSEHCARKTNHGSSRKGPSLGFIGITTTRSRAPDADQSSCTLLPGRNRQTTRC